MTVTTSTTSSATEASATRHETAGPALVGDVTSFPSHAELARTLIGVGGVGTMSTLTASGHPYASLAPFSVVADGSPLICVSDLAEHTQNLRRDPRSSVLFGETVPDGVDPLALARVTLVGSFVPHSPHGREIEAHLQLHPLARHYIGFDDFSWWRFQALSLRYVGGFGFMGWITADEFAVADIDPIIPVSAPMIEHLNDDHADACLEIARHLGGVGSATAATVVAIDRHGLTLDVLIDDDARSLATARVAFPTPLNSPSDVRSATVDLVARARAVAD
ncbi:MAG: HugZ family protein [Ilumatobacter sp.]|uniref:HugZ family pyridoxamine 5'-phosphate oxidase n=1 Tax=Ilumatobacter sp. TaxID=1967498 RepID=UPI0039188649